MENLIEKKLPSGAVLKITLSPFAISRALYQAVAEEARGLKVEAKTEIDVNLFKDLACLALASKKIEAAVWECMKRATYNDNKITEETFEKREARDDYFMVMFEVARENILPFTKSLYAEYSHLLEALKQKSPV